jgi:hypothetical protein
VALPTVFVLLAVLAAQEPAAPPWAGEDFSGRYRLSSSEEFLQLNLQPLPAATEEEEEQEPARRLTGFLSRRGDTESNRGAVLDHFLTLGRARGQEVEFTTRPIHGVWFRFSGRVERGPGETRSQPGYFVLRGRLTRYVRDSHDALHERRREVELPSLPPDPLTARE